MDNRAMWTPPEDSLTRSNMGRFIRFIQKEHNPDVTDYQGLYDFSIHQREKFWSSVWEFCGIRSSQAWESVYEDGDKMPGTQWFPGSRLNFAQNLLRYNDDKPAIYFEGESGTGKSLELSYAKLNKQVHKLATAMRNEGIKAGDVIAGYLPNMPHTIIAMLATASIGAVWTSCSPDFGSEGAIDRFGQVEPLMLFACDGYDYNGKRHNRLETVRDICDAVNSIKKVIIIPFLVKSPSLDLFDNAVLFRDFSRKGKLPPMTFEQLPFDHPLYILYSSGTTGKPKCIVHSAGGTLIQHLKELVLHTDLRREDSIFYFTTCGWMMWNWLVSSLAVGARLVLYDGSPFYPGPGALFDLAERQKLTVFGSSAKWLSAIEKSGYLPGEEYSLKTLRVLLSTGSPLLAEQFDFVYKAIKPDIRLSSISGGTDIVSCFALGCPILPVYRGELQCRGLGMQVEIRNDAGEIVQEEVGELTCSASFPSMPTGFWNDANDERYRSAYFEKYPGIWSQGDLAELTGHGGLVIYGRSDATLNPGGVRIGTAEIYRQIEKIQAITESVVVGQKTEDDERIILFVILREGLELDEDMEILIRATIRNHTSPRHVPAVILQVEDIPRTFSGKISELAVKAVVNGQEVKNANTLANPEALELFKNPPQPETC